MVGTLVPVFKTVSLARATLIYEWRRFLPAVLAVAFAGLLVLVQLGLLLGMFSTVSVYIDRSAAHLWVGYPNTQSVDLARPILGKVENHLRMNPEVTAVERFTWSVGDWRAPNGGKLTAVVIGINSRSDAMTFSGLLSPRLRSLLLTPGNVLVDVADLYKLGVKVGDNAELSGKTVRVAGTVTGIRSLGAVNILASLSTARYLDANLRKDTTDYFLLRLHDPMRAEAVRAALQPTGTFKPFEVWTAQEFSIKSQLYWLLESGAGAGALFASVLGLLVGVVITSQTLMGAILASLREYATLRALGVSTASLRAVVVEQSFWVGVAGLAVTAVATVGVIGLARASHVSLKIPPEGFVFTAILILLVALLSGLGALRALSQAEPSTLLR